VLFLFFKIDARGQKMCKKETRKYFAGNLIIKEGDNNEYAFVIMKGSVEVYKKLTEGKVIPITVLGKGQLIGEMSLFGEKTCTASVKALTDVELQVLDKKIFEKYLEETPPLIRMLLEILAGKLLKTSQKYLLCNISEAKINKFKTGPRIKNIDYAKGKVKEH